MFADIDWSNVIVIVIGILIALIVAALVLRLFRVAVVFLILAVVVPVAITILCGDGETYVAKFSSLFSPSIETQINEAYQDYSEKEKSDPIISQEGLSDAADELWSGVKSVFETSQDKIQELWEASQSEATSEAGP